jgi:hypothetical protein
VGIKNGVSRRINVMISTLGDVQSDLWWAGQESNLHSFRGGFTDRWARHVPFADPR